MNSIEKRLTNFVTYICEEYADKKDSENSIKVSILSERDTIEFARLVWEMDNRNISFFGTDVNGPIQTAITLSLSSMQNFQKLELADAIEKVIVEHYFDKMQFLLNTEVTYNKDVTNDQYGL